MDDWREKSTFLHGQKEKSEKSEKERKLSRRPKGEKKKKSCRRTKSKRRWVTVYSLEPPFRFCGASTTTRGAELSGFSTGARLSKTRRCRPDTFIPDIHTEWIRTHTKVPALITETVHADWTMRLWLSRLKIVHNEIKPPSRPGGKEGGKEGEKRFRIFIFIQFISTLNRHETHRRVSRYWRERRPGSSTWVTLKLLTPPFPIENERFETQLFQGVPCGGRILLHAV